MTDETKYGSVRVHEVTMERVDTRRRCRSCPKGARKRITHALTNNGLAFECGCEWHAYSHLRAMRQALADLDADLRIELSARDDETLFDASARILSTPKQRTQLRLAAHALLESRGMYPGLRRALRFARTTGESR